MVDIMKYSEEFELAFTRILKIEGGYVNNPDDPGGETKYGISKRQFPFLDIKKLKLDDAKKIYFENYWKDLERIKFLPPEINFKRFAISILYGSFTANKIFQRAIRACQKMKIADDGILGKQTNLALAKIKDYNLLHCCLKCEEASVARVIIAKKPKRQVFKEGWLNRAYENTQS